MPATDFEAIVIDEIKYYVQLVRGCGEDGRKRTVCRRIVELGNGYGARVVAEGKGNGPF